MPETVSPSTARQDFFAAARPCAPGQSFTQAMVTAIDAAADALGLPKAAAPARDANGLSVRIVLEVAHHEAIVQEMYLDSEGVRSWAMGVTNASGHNVDRYKDNPQPMRKCVEVSVWLMRTKYLPSVLRAFGGRQLTEAQLAAALSFHWNTGAIERTDWVKLFLAGKLSEARAFLVSHYLNGGDLTARRKAEAALFFDGIWSNDGTTTVYDVAKPGYRPKWSSARRVDISADVAAVLGASS